MTFLLGLHKKQAFGKVYKKKRLLYKNFLSDEFETKIDL